ncbi:MAG: YceI family protein [Bacteroidetes bacterium]|nr:YceI family protein [Bacteroidota bacterium]
MSKSKWIIDHAHSTVGFKVKHLMLTYVSGEFLNYDSAIETENEDFMHAMISFSAKSDSISTSNGQRDEHIKSADFLDCANYPNITFKATKYESIDNDGSYELYGDLTIRNITKPVKLDVEFGGVLHDPWGNAKAGFTINGKFSRNDFGLVWNQALETGGVLVSDDIRVSCEIQLVKQ